MSQTDATFSARVTTAATPLRPQHEIDEQGCTRVIFSLGGMTFSFKAAEELPIYPTLRDSACEVIGQGARLLSEGEISAWRTQLGRQGPKHILVQRSLSGVAELGLRLLPGHSYLARAQHEAITRRNGDAYLSLLDNIIAVEKKLRAEQTTPTVYAEAVVLLALSGDEQAAALAREATAELHAEVSGGPGERAPRRDVEPLKVDDLVCVHAARYPPRRESADSFSVGPLFDVYPSSMRLSVHVALNHKVATHLYGSWDDTSYVLVAPLKSMIQANGPPTVLNTVDTYWVVNPRQRLYFPNCTLVVMQNGQLSQLFEERGNVYAVQGSGYRGEHAALIYDWLGHDPYRQQYLCPDLYGLASFCTDPHLAELLKMWDFGQRRAWNWRQDPPPNPPRLPGTPEFIEVCRAYPGHTIRNIWLALLDQVPSEAYRGDALTIGHARDRLSAPLAKATEQKLRAALSSLATRDIIWDRGFTVQPGGGWAWGGSWEVTAQTIALADELGVLCGAHSNMPDSYAEEEARIAETDTYTLGKSTFKWPWYAPTFSTVFSGMCGIQQMRATYESGTLIDAMVASERAVNPKAMNSTGQMALE